MNVFVDNPYVLIGVKELDKALKYEFIYQKDPNQQESFSAIIKKIRPSMAPDFIFRTFPEYCLFAEERVFDCPIIGFISDWTIMYQSIMRMAKYFDCIFIDTKGVKMIKGLGLKNVHHTQMYSFDPNLLRRLPRIKKIYDASIVANLTHHWHPQRAHWLKRLALQSDRYKIRIFTKKSKEEYVKILNQSKITFNFSLRSEMNQRAYEAPACGSLLFLEEGNSEVRNFFTDKKHCVLYNKNNFESLLHSYLAHDQERNRIIEQAYKKVQGYSYFYQFRRIKRDLEKAGWDRINKEKARINQINPAQRYSDMATCDFLLACWLQFDYHKLKVQRHFLNKIKRDFKELLCRQPDHPEALNNMGVFYAMLPVFSVNKKLSSAKKKNWLRAIDFIRKATERNHLYAIAFFNLGQVYLLMGEKKLAQKEFLKAVDILKSNAKNDISGSSLCLPLNFDSFHMQWQRALIKSGEKNSRAGNHLNGLLLHRVYEKLGDIYAARKSKALSLAYYKKSLAYWPKAGVVEYKLGRVLQDIGDLEKAVRCYKKSMDASPFYFPAWRAYVRGLFALNRRKECALASKKFITIFNAFADYKHRKRPFVKMLGLAKRVKDAT